MKKLCYSVGLTLLFACGSDDDSGNSGTPSPNDTTSDIAQYAGYTLIWNDEFNSSEIDASKWVYETGDGTDFGLPVGWGNAELQIYTTDEANSSIKTDDGNSVLAITAIESGGAYTSAKMTTNGTFGARFGRIETRAKLPEGKGIWPAFWTLGTNRSEIDWPGCGEIDIFEMLGDNTSKIYSTVHYVEGSANNTSKGENQGSQVLSSGTFSEDYHLFRLDWTPESMSFYVDGILTNQVTIEEDMKEFLREHYLILNVAVGGFWPGNPDASTVFPQEMLIDFVRVYSKDDLNPPAPPVLDPQEETIGQFIESSIADNAVKDGYEDFGSIDVMVFGGGGEPEILVSPEAIDGDSSVLLKYPGGAWGGAFFILDNPVDFSSLTGGNLHFSIHTQADLNDVEIKLESPNQATSAAVFLVNYTGTDIGNGWIEYSIPLADFSGLDLSELAIPFAMWNPMDTNGDFVPMDILVDNLYIQ